MHFNEKLWYHEIILNNLFCYFISIIIKFKSHSHQFLFFPFINNGDVP